jgi:DNA-binding transcriptional LysR family regulator
MDWDDLRFFLAVARSGSLAAGARLLKVKHSTVLRRISNLENRLGARLFDRTPTGYFLTQAGADIMDTAQEVEAAAFEIERRTLGRDRALTGELRVSMTDVVGRQVAGALTAFRRLNPGIVVDVLITAEPLSLAKRQADVAIRVGARPEPYLIGRRLLDVHFAVYGTQDYLDARPISKTMLPGWAAYDWVVLDQDGEAFPQASWERKHIAEELVAMRTNSSPLVFDAVRAGMGVAILATASADTDPSFVRVSDEVFDFGLGTWVLTHADLRRIPRVRAFMDFIVGEAKRPTVGFPFR